MDARRSTTRAIAFLLIGGVAFRLLLAYLILPYSEYNGDIRWYIHWTSALASVGPRDFYASAIANYPPGYLYVLWLVAEVSKAIASAGDLDIAIVIRWLLQIPPILLDACAAFMLYRIASSWTPERENADRAGLLAAAIFLFNPVTVYDSAIWAQVDVTGACIILAALLSLTRGPPEISAAIAVFAALIKPQFGVVLAPLVGIVLLRRHLKLRSLVSGSEKWVDRDGPIRLLTSTVVSVLLFYAVVTPFGLGLRSYLDLTNATAAQYPYLTMNAFNPWALVGSDAGPPLMFSYGRWLRDDVPLLGPVSAVTIGGTLLLCGFLVGGARLLQRADRYSIVIVGLHLCMCFFMLPTRVHERYIYPAFALLPLLAALDRKWLWVAVALTVGSLINLHGVLTVFVPMPLGELFRSPSAIFVSTVLHTAVFLFVVWSLRPSASAPQMFSAERSAESV